MAGAMRGELRFLVLGPMDIRIGDAALLIRRPVEQRLVAVLLLGAGQVVPLNHLVDAVWDDDPPQTARKQIQNAVSRLRGQFACFSIGDLVTTDSAGYRLSAEPGSVDLWEFDHLVDLAGRAAGDGDRLRAARVLRRALDLWRGPALAGLPGRRLEAAATAWNERRIAVAVDYCDHVLALGQHDRVVGELTALVAEHPTAERLVGQLARALYRSGRRADSLGLLDRTGRVLARELGVGVGPGLLRLRERIRAGVPDTPPDGAGPAVPDPAAGVSAGREAEPRRPAANRVPRQLPAGIGRLVGRSGEIRALNRLAGRTGTAGSVVVAVLSGTAGIGKTTLALAWAHTVSGRFPDGQLYADLNGYSGTDEATGPATVLQQFLDALGVPAGDRPADLGPLAAMYRSLLADRRMLIVLDNARDTGQVRPLLPAGPGCLVLVTSRHALTGLISRYGAEPLALDLLGVREAAELLAVRLGPGRVAAEPAATAEVIGLCARLPLALAIAATRAATRGQALRQLADELRRDRLGGLDDRDDAGVRAVFDWSYRTLSPPAADLFRRLGTHPGPDISLAAAIQLAGRPTGPTRAALTELVGAHLLSERPGGRFCHHDLLREYAAHQARVTDGDDGIAAALDRVLRHYLATGQRAALALNPARQPLPADPSDDPPGVTMAGAAADDEAAAAPVDRATAWDWFEAECPVLLATVRYAAAHRRPAAAWRLSWCLADYLHQRGRWQDWRDSQLTALAAAERLADRAATARCHHYLGYACARLGDHRAGERHLLTAERQFTALGDTANLAHVHLTRAVTLEARRRLPDALSQARRALELYRRDGRRPALANAHNAVGWYSTLLGDHRTAVEACRQAIDVHREQGNVSGEAATWDSLGHAHQQLGRHDEAMACYRRAVEMQRHLGDRYNLTIPLVHLGETQATRGDPAAAERAWREALDILDGLGHPDAEPLRARLAETRLRRPTARPTALWLDPAMSGTRWDLLDRSHQALRVVAAGIAGADWRRATPCARWNVAQVLQHASGDQLAYAARLTDGPPPPFDPFAPPESVEGDPAGLLESALKTSAAAFAGVAQDAAEVPVPLPPFSLPPALAVGAAALDAAIHAWDLAVATGQPSPLTPSMARDLRPAADRLAEPLRGFAYGPPVEPAVDADDPVRSLLGFLGRRPDWTAPAAG